MHLRAVFKTVKVIMHINVQKYKGQLPSLAIYYVVFHININSGTRIGVGCICISLYRRAAKERPTA